MRPPISRPELTRRLARLDGFEDPDPAREQVDTPPEAATELLMEAWARGDLVDRVVADLGAGPGRLGIGAALFGARRVLAVESDRAALAVAERNAQAEGVRLELRPGEVGAFTDRVDTVVMNPPFGAQRRHADRDFWDAAFRCASRASYAFALGDSRTFIARRVVERSVPVVETHPVPWALTARFRHHRKPSVPLAVDLWVLGPASEQP